MIRERYPIEADPPGHTVRALFLQLLREQVLALRRQVRDLLAEIEQLKKEDTHASSRTPK